MTASTLISSVVLSRYAGALVDLAEESKSVEKISKDFQDIAKMISESAELDAVIRSPVVSKARQLGLVEDLTGKGKFDKLTRNFLGVLVQNRRLGALEGIIKAFNRIVAERKGETAVKVQTAVPMSEAQAKELQTKISTALGHDVALEMQVDPSILGGMIVTIGSQMIDDSVRRKLERLNSALVKGANTNNTHNLKEVV